MKSHFALAAAFARIAVAAPAPQQFDPAAILEAPTPDLVGPPVGAISASTYSINTASAAASIAADISTIATASITGASASAASTEQPTDTVTALQQRGWWQSTTSSNTQPASSASLSVPVLSTSSPSATVQQSSTLTTSSTTACATTPEAGTYCGFINPEDPCAPQPDGYGPKVTPDTPAAFEAYPAFHVDALTAITPPTYSEVFRDLNASTSANSYITFHDLQSYNVSECANYCDTTNLCTAFNIYIERDPSVNPTSGSPSNGSYCPNPPSITNYKCSLWGSSIDAASATNTGQFRDQFQVVIAASNGYDKTNHTTPPSIPGYDAPQPCPGGAISAGGSYWMGSNFFPGPFNPSLCSIYGQAQTNQNKQAARARGAAGYTPCNMFNAYMVTRNGVAQGTYCSLFDTTLGAEWAGFQGGWSGADFFAVESSWTYALSQQDDGKW